MSEGDRRVWIGFAAAGAGGVLLVGVALLGLRGYQDSADATLDAAQTYAAVSAVYIELIEAESNRRGYLLTGDASLLEAYEADLAAIPPALDALDARLIGDRGAPMAELRALVDARIALGERAIDLKQAGDDAGLEELIAVGRGSELMAQIRENMVGIVIVEGERHTSSRDSASQRAAVSTVAIIATAVLTVLLLAWIFFMLRKRGQTLALERANEAKDALLAMVAHELRTPATVVVGNARALTRYGDSLSEDERKDALADIASESERLARLVENMMLLSRREGTTVDTEPLRVDAIVQAAAERHQRNHPGCEVEVAVGSGMRVAQGYPPYLEQVLENLLVNAMKYGPPGGPITISASEAGSGITVSVMDRGPGVPPSQAESIFEPFTRLPETAQRASGVGLGLAVCKRLMAAQGGKIAVAARSGGGSVFTVFLPAATPTGDPMVAGPRVPRSDS
ncbi:MAG: sensor histidine kinase [Tepidiformaceae bacterium]